MFQAFSSPSAHAWAWWLLQRDVFSRARHGNETDAHTLGGCDGAAEAQQEAPPLHLILKQPGTAQPNWSSGSNGLSVQACAGPPHGARRGSAARGAPVAAGLRKQWRGADGGGGAGGSAGRPGGGVGPRGGAAAQAACGAVLGTARRHPPRRVCRVLCPADNPAGKPSQASGVPRAAVSNFRPKRRAIQARAGWLVS